MKISNDLTNAELERLAILSEEMGEVQQTIGKIIRFGYESCNPSIITGQTNRHDLEREIADVQVAINMLLQNRDVNGDGVALRMKRKAENIKPYLHHQEPSK
ncbi:MAG TPA: hypothetical protein VGQ12_07450 [Candidatus Angelobacter sp.]|nr:hypothetical protein [Candidatus Angelobacter sp.]